jgi:DMSO/TMAO reductase YedYZ heme-binding membrane subunit
VRLAFGQVGQPLQSSFRLLNRWKQLQRFVYPAALLTLLHWIFVHNDFGPALVNFAPLAALEIYRVWKINKLNDAKSAA